MMDNLDFTPKPEKEQDKPMEPLGIAKRLEEARTSFPDPVQGLTEVSRSSLLRVPEETYPIQLIRPASTLEPEEEGEWAVDILIAIDTNGRGVILGFFNNIHYILKEYLECGALWDSSSGAFEEEPGLYRFQAGYRSWVEPWTGEEEDELTNEKITPFVLADPDLLNLYAPKGKVRHDQRSLFE